MKLFFLLCAVAIAAPAERPIQLHPENPHYFLYKGKPAVLITSGEHYSSVLNLRFDYSKYLEELRRNGFNLTRTFSGTYREASADPHGATPLSPGRGPENYISPWAMSDVDGGYDGKKYDLDRWNPAYFERLRGFVKKAGEKGVVVELVLFCLMYSDQNHWQISPLYPDNNLQGERWRGLPNRRVLTLDSPELVARQKAVTRKIVTELRDMPNVYFEVANEPAPTPADSQLASDNFAWHEAIISEIVAAESSLPPESRHMIAYNDHYTAAPRIGRVPNPAALSILNIHYLPRVDAILSEYAMNKALSMDETHWIGHPKLGEYNNTMTPASGRLEAWEFIIGGGAVYSNLNFAYQVKSEEGRTAASDEFKGYLRSLKTFVGSFNLARMRQDRAIVLSGLPESSTARAITEPGKQYAVYIHYGKANRGKSLYEPDDTPRKFETTLDLPAGNYRVEWIRPSDLALLGRQTIEKHPGGKIKLAASPEHKADIALRILAKR